MDPINGIARDLFPYPQHRATLVAFFDIVAPEIRPVTGNQLDLAMAKGALTDEVAVSKLRELWADDAMGRHARQAEDPPLA